MSYLGIRGFERLLKDGIPSPGAVLLRAPPIPERDQVSAQFLAEGLREEERAVLIAPESVARRIEGALRRLGIDVDDRRRSGALTVVPVAATFAAEADQESVPLEIAEAVVWKSIAAPERGPRRFLVDVLPRPRVQEDVDASYAFANRLAPTLRRSASASLVVVPRDGDVPGDSIETFDAILDLRSRQPEGVVLALAAFDGAPFPRAPLALEEFEGALVLVDAAKVDPSAVEVPCPICGTKIPPGARECPTCGALRPAVSRQRGILAYLESLRTQVGIPEETRQPLGRRSVRLRVLEGSAVAGRGPPGGPPDELAGTFAATRRDLTDGVTDDVGVTSGLGSERPQTDTRPNRWKVFLIPLVAESLVLASLLLVPDVGWLAWVLSALVLLSVLLLVVYARANRGRAEGRPRTPAPEAPGGPTEASTPASGGPAENDESP